MVSSIVFGSQEKDSFLKKLDKEEAKEESQK